MYVYMYVCNPLASYYSLTCVSTYSFVVILDFSNLQFISNLLPTNEDIYSQ